MNGRYRVLTSLLKEGVMNYDVLSSATGLPPYNCQEHSEQLCREGLVRIMPFGGAAKEDVVILLTPHGKLTAAKLTAEIY